MLEMFNLLDSENEDAFEDNANKIAEVSHDFGHLAYRCVQEFDQKFSVQKVDVDNVADSMLEFFISCMQKGVQLGVSFLNKTFDANISEEDYARYATLNEHSFFTFVNTFLQSFFIPYQRLVKEYGNAEDNQLLYDTGERWVGGGLGISGAIAGAIQAELLNTGTDILRSGINALFSKGNHAVLKKEVQKLLSDIEVWHSLRDSLYESVCATCVGALEFLNLFHKVIFSVEDVQLGFEIYDEAACALYNTENISQEIKTESDLYQQYTVALVIHFKMIPFSTRMMDDLLILGLPDLPAALVYDRLQSTGREQFFRDKWFDFVSNEVHEAQKRPVKTAQDLADTIQTIQNILEGTPFNADDILADLSDQYHSRHIWELYCAAKQDPFAKKSRDFWMNTDPIAEYLTIYCFTEERFPKAEELVSLMLSKNAPAAYAIAAEWEIKNHNYSNYAKAKSFLEQGIKLNSPGCIFRMATVVLNGYWNTTANVTKGRAFLDKAVRMEYPDAVNYLDTSLRRNTFGYESDGSRLRWCEKRLKNWGLPKEYFTKHPDAYRDSLLWQWL